MAHGSSKQTDVLARWSEPPKHGSQTGLAIYPAVNCAQDLQQGFCKMAATEEEAKSLDQMDSAQVSFGPLTRGFRIVSTTLDLAGIVQRVRDNLENSRSTYAAFGTDENRRIGAMADLTDREVAIILSALNCDIDLLKKWADDPDISLTLQGSFGVCEELQADIRKAIGWKAK